MPGSKKGERRGGAKPGHVRKTPKREYKSLPRKTKGLKAIATADPEVGRILSSHRPVEQKERELERYFLVSGKRMRWPKDVMLDAMRYFEETAIDYLDVGRANERAALATEDATAKQVYNNAAAQAEHLGREYLITAVDVAYKAAAFVHPRLAAILSNPSDADQANTIAVLLRDLDEAGRPRGYIDHDPMELERK